MEEQNRSNNNFPKKGLLELQSAALSSRSQRYHLDAFRGKWSTIIVVVVSESQKGHCFEFLSTLSVYLDVFSRPTTSLRTIFDIRQRHTFQFSIPYQRSHRLPSHYPFLM